MLQEYNEALVKPESKNQESKESCNLYEDWLVSSPSSSPGRISSTHTILVKSVAQSYQEMFQNIYLVSDATSKGEAKGQENSGFNGYSTTISHPSPKEYSGSLLEFKDLSNTFYASILEQAQESENEVELERFYCKKCKKMTSPIVSLKLKQMNIWNSLRFFLENLKCCSSNIDLQKYHEYAYSCSFCKDLILQRPIVVS